MPARPALLLAVSALALAACGQNDDERRVRDTLEGFAEATAKKDYQRLCDDIFSERLVEEVRRSLPCELALRRSSLDDARNPKLEIRSIRLNGTRASAVVRSTAANQPPSEDTVQLVKESDEWRIVALAS